MATKFYNVEKVAEILGISPAEVNEMRERQELHGYRDGANWKFKAEEIDQLASQKVAGGAPLEVSDDEDVLLTEVELGQSDPSTSGTILGPPPADALGSSLSGFEDLDLTMSESGLDMSALDMSSVSSLTGVSELDLSSAGLDDDDLVLGASGSGSGSDLTIGGDSGISLLDPSDSGISLEEPLELAGSSHGSFALGDSRAVASGKKADNEAATELGTDSDFMLTPMDESSEGDEESSSQVIALDEEDDSEDLISAPPLLDEVAEPLGATAPMTEALSLELPAAGLVVAPAAGVTDYTVPQRDVSGAAAAALPEAPYTTLNIIGLALCTIILMLVGMMMYDLMRNMWSWNQPMPVNSWLMDLLS